MQTFVDFLRACHFTCLFSHAEAFGLSNRESLRLGVPMLASDVGGIADAVPQGCGHLFAREADAGDVANAIEAYVRDPDRYWALRDTIARRSDEFSWAAAVEKMQAIWSGSDAYRYQASGPHV
jgi:glycosyltransferase involved in cell wall biosynthesis